VIPPPTPPDLSAIVMEWPGSDPADVLLKWTSAAPLKKTPLGSHTIAVRAKRVGAPLEEAPLIALNGVFMDLGATQPGTGSGVWRIDGSKPIAFRALVRRADINHAVDISVRITDPVGRSSESLARIEPGHILPDPNLESFVLNNSVNPPGKTLGWSSATPLDLGYVLQVVVARPPIQLFPSGPFVPQPPLQLQMALDDIPLDEPGPVPPGSDPLRVRRMPGSGPKFNYYAFVRVPFTQIVVQLTSPDGRFTQHTQPSN
jgi:hypothetical protein